MKKTLAKRGSSFQILAKRGSNFQMLAKRGSHFKKLMAMLAAVVRAVSLLTGCHGSQGRAEFQVPETLDESGTTEITFWAKNDTNKTQTMIYEKAISDFEALYPHIKVNMRLYTDYGKI